MSSINRDPSFNTHKKETRNRMKTNKMVTRVQWGRVAMGIDVGDSLSLMAL